jgi:hypothetical protein
MLCFNKAEMQHCHKFGKYNRLGQRIHNYEAYSMDQELRLKDTFFLPPSQFGKE